MEKIKQNHKISSNQVDPIRSVPKVELVNINEWHKAWPSTKTLTIKWEKSDLGWIKNEKAEVQLFGYYEEDDGPHFDFLQKLGTDLENTGKCFCLTWGLAMSNKKKFKYFSR